MGQANIPAHRLEAAAQQKRRHKYLRTKQLR